MRIEATVTTTCEEAPNDHGYLKFESHDGGESVDIRILFTGAGIADVTLNADRGELLCAILAVEQAL